MGVCFKVKRTTPLLRLLSLCVSAVLFSGFSSAWDTLQKESGKLTSVSARFTQLKDMRILARPLVSTGRFYFKAPDSVRWEYETPVQSILLMNEGLVRRYTQGPKGLIEDAGAVLQAMNVMLSEIALWSRGRFNESTSFAAEMKPTSESVIVLIPRDEGLAKVITGIEVEFVPEKPGVISKITIREGSGGITTLQFSDVVINAPLNDSVFRSP